MDRSRREMFLFKSELNKAKKKRRELHSLRCDLAYKLHVGSCTALHCTALHCTALHCTAHITHAGLSLERQVNASCGIVATA